MYADANAWYENNQNVTGNDNDKHVLYIERPDRS